MMVIAPVVSVIIPCYKQAHFLADAIESALAQTYASIEIIVVDDGSPDNTAEVASRYGSVRYVRQENQGLSGARNTGIRASTGQYLVFLDADDRLVNDAIQLGLDCLAAHPESAFVSGHHRYIHGDGSLRNEYPPEALRAEPYYELLKRNYIGMHATVMYRRALFDLEPPFNTSLRSCEDYDLYLRIARQHPVYRHDHIVAEYRWHDGNMSSNAPRMLKTALWVLHSQWQYIIDTPRYVEACTHGVRFWRGYYLQNIRSKLETDLRDRQWHRSAQDVMLLVRFLPQWFAAAWMEARLRATSIRQKRVAHKEHW